MAQNLTYPYTTTSKRTNIKRISHCNDESVEPTGFAEAIFDIITTFGTVQP